MYSFNKEIKDIKFFSDERFSVLAEMVQSYLTREQKPMIDEMWSILSTDESIERIKPMQYLHFLVVIISKVKILVATHKLFAIQCQQFYNILFCTSIKQSNGFWSVSP